MKGTGPEHDEKSLEARARRLSPTRIAQAWRCPHSFYLDEVGDQAKKLEPSAGQVLDRERGIQFEDGVVHGLEGVQEPSWDRKDLAKGARATKTLIDQGISWIHGGVLMTTDMVGVPDLLQCRPGKSKSGHVYVPVEIKNHKEVQKRDILQVVGYAQALEEVLGVPCTRGGVWLNTGRVEWIDVAEHLPLFRETVGLMRRIRERQAETEPIWCEACGTCPWVDFCKSEWERLGHLSLLPGGGRGTVKKLYPLGIKTVQALAKADPGEMAARARMSEAAASRLWHHARARVLGRPIQIKEPNFRENLPRIFYDIETYGGTIFLHGLIRVHGKEREERFFFADTLDQEASVWHEFLDYMAGQAKAIVWCWANYERGNAEACWKRHGGSRKGYKVLMDSLVDQCKWTSEHFAFPTRSYSIKAVAPAIGFRWKAEDAGGLNCEAWYGEWLRRRDQDLRAKILEYNRDDVLAMEAIYIQLREIA